LPRPLAARLAFALEKGGDRRKLIFVVEIRTRRASIPAAPAFDAVATLVGA
jgi:hypothetical protein